MSRLTLSALCLALFACGVSTPAPRTTHPVGPIPLSVWTLPSNRCDSWLMEPATHCRGALVHDFNGCRWRCVWPPIEGARQ